MGDVADSGTAARGLRARRRHARRGWGLAHEGTRARGCARVRSVSLYAPATVDRAEAVRVVSRRRQPASPARARSVQLRTKKSVTFDIVMIRTLGLSVADCMVQ